MLNELEQALLKQGADLTSTDAQEMLEAVRSGDAEFVEGVFRKAVLAYAVVVRNADGRCFILKEHNSFENDRHKGKNMAKLPTETLLKREYDIRDGEIVFTSVHDVVSRAIHEELGIRVMSQPFDEVVKRLVGATNYVSAANDVGVKYSSSPAINDINSHDVQCHQLKTCSLNVKPRLGIPRDYKTRAIFIPVRGQMLAEELTHYDSFLTLQKEERTITEFIWQSWSSFEDLAALLKDTPSVFTQTDFQHIRRALEGDNVRT